MRRAQARAFWCPVVSETVRIRLKRASGFGGPSPFFVQCDQEDCQYVDENKPPCPLHPGMFAEETRTGGDAGSAPGGTEDP